MTLAEIAQRLDARIEGDGSLEITGLAGLAEAGAGDLSFLSNPRYASQVATTGATAVIVGEDWDGSCPGACLRVADPDAAFAQAGGLLGPEPVVFEPGIHPSAVVAPDARLGADVCVGPGCVIESGVRVGDRCLLCAGVYLGHGTALGEDCRLYPQVSVREGAKLGDRVVIHNGAVIGSDGFGYLPTAEGWRKIPQIGVVRIGDDVEIGANTTIDRARFGETVIGNGVKIDNLVQVAHNVRIGDHTAIAAQVAVAGSTTVGSRVMIAGQAALTGHIHVGDGAVVGGQAAVTKDVPPNTFVSGYPAMPHGKARRLHAHMMRLPDLKKRVAELEKRLEDLERKSGQAGSEQE